VVRKELDQDCYLTAQWPKVEPMTLWMSFRIN